ncbi:unnamed protein product [Fraxinus pennsylvanica]|uniref:NB-ARC domain-containing protein n=1 Tax=Fraxinus pennsylvanica TaxID=56036 RepID=A0AAD2DMM7_9LAMI|nr:unnamed protein product [Fraxinus pennsylvanica]
MGFWKILNTRIKLLLCFRPAEVPHFIMDAAVSQRYCEQEVLSRLLHSVRDLNHESSQESVEKLAEKLYKSLNKKRYLIVLDDVWHKEVVLNVKSLLPHDSNGSRILLTSRLAVVAMYADPNVPIYITEFRTQEDCWRLLNKLVFDKEMYPLELVKLGKEIAINCRGLPLSLTLIGGVLYKAERTLSYWMHIAQHTSTSVVTSAKVIEEEKTCLGSNGFQVVLKEEDTNISS